MTITLKEFISCQDIKDEKLSDKYHNKSFFHTIDTLSKAINFLKSFNLNCLSQIIDGMKIGFKRQSPIMIHLYLLFRIFFFYVNASTVFFTRLLILKITLFCYLDGDLEDVINESVILIAYLIHGPIFLCVVCVFIVFTFVFKFFIIFFVAQLNIPSSFLHIDQHNF